MRIYNSHNEGRINFDFDTNYNKIYVSEVKTYGKIWGWILNQFGFASALQSEGKKSPVYVNTASLIKHMLSTRTFDKKLEQVVKEVKLNKSVAKKNLDDDKAIANFYECVLNASNNIPQFDKESKILKELNEKFPPKVESKNYEGQKSAIVDMLTYLGQVPQELQENVMLSYIIPFGKTRATMRGIMMILKAIDDPTLKVPNVDEAFKIKFKKAAENANIYFKASGYNFDLD